MAKLTPRANRIAAAGKLLFGDTCWQSPLAPLTGLSPALMQKVSDGTREVTADIYRMVAEALLNEAVRMHKAADKIDEMALRMFAERKE